MGDTYEALARKYGDDRGRVLGLIADREREEQIRQLARVKSGIGKAICGFFQMRAGQTFFADELRAFVAEHCGPRAPASADRIMRALKRDGEIQYELLNRSRSLYRAGP